MRRWPHIALGIEWQSAYRDMLPGIAYASSPRSQDPIAHFIHPTFVVSTAHRRRANKSSSPATEMKLFSVAVTIMY